MSSEILGAILAAPTFWRGAALWGGAFAAALVLAWVPLAILRQRLERQPLRPDVRGTATAVDFVLTLPIFMIFVSLAVQFAVLLNGTVVVHYAAYSAARSARVWVAELAARSPFALPSVPVAVPVPAQVTKHAEAAARMALVAVSPADRDVPSNASAAPVATLRAVASAAGMAERGDVFAAKAGYAFDPQNSTIEVRARWKNGAPVVTASVEYRIHTGILAGRYLGQDRGDGVRALPARATVELQ